MCCVLWCIGSECVEGEVLLNRGYGGRNLSLVEWCNDRGKWESVCDTEWSREDAETVCRQAGFNRGTLIIFYFYLTN